VLLTAPRPLLDRIVPAHLAVADQILPASAIAGLGYGASTLAVTLLQGAGRYRAAMAGLAGESPVWWAVCSPGGWRAASSGWLVAARSARPLVASSWW